MSYSPPPEPHLDPLSNIDATICPLSQFFSGNVFGDWLALSALALFTSVIILMFFYLIATFMRSQSHITSIKGEFFEVLSTLAILSYIAIAITPLCNLKVGLFFPDSPNNDKTIYNATMTYFNKVENKFETWMQMQYRLNLYIDLLASSTTYARPLGLGLVTTPLAGLALPIKSFLYNAFTAMAIAYVINEAQKYVFVFATYGFLKYYLPIGVFLRSFTPTRRIGGSLIAISISFVILFPIIMTITEETMLGENGPLIGIENMVKQAYESKLGGVECKEYDPDQTKCIEWEPAGPLKAFSKRFFLPDISSPDFDLGTFLSGGFLIIIGEWIKDVVGDSLGFMLFIPLSTIGMAFVLGYLMPALNVLILVQTTKSFSRVLGEEVDITALTRML
jgi:hypothetical protein